MNSKDITVTQPRARNAIEKQVSKIVTPQIETKVEKAVADDRIRTGIITKFYPYWDKAEVKLDNVKEIVLCKILHRYGGDMMDFYTPAHYKKIYDEKRREVAIIPKAAHHVCVLRIHDADSVENLILGYYQNKDIVGFEPAAPGNLNLMSINDTNIYWINFGAKGLELRLSSKPTFISGNLPSRMDDFDYADSTNVYTKDECYNKKECYNKTECYNKQEVYTKEEVDELIAEKVAEALAELQGADNNDATD